MKFFEYAFGDSDSKKEFLKPNKQLGIARCLILLAAISCFVYFTAARFIMIGIAILLCLLKGTRDKVFADRSNFIILLFTIITSLVAFINGNYIGLGRTCVFASMMVIFTVTRKIATKKFYEMLLNVICLGGCLATAYSIVEMIIMSKKVPGYRCEVTFSNANFFGVAVMMVILICAYKVVSRVKRPFVYYIIAVFNAVGLYLSGSMSLWIIASIGIVLLLILNHDYKLLALFLLAVVAALLLVILVPQFLPRINQLGTTTNNRIAIWNFAIEQIKEAPFFGRGFFSYKHLYNTMSPTRPDIYKAALSHNLLLDCLLCHGLVGTSLIGIYMINFVRKIFIVRDCLRKNKKSYLNTVFATATCAAIACYGLMDTTFVWVQTGMILLFILSGVGVDERKYRHIKKEIKEV